MTATRRRWALRVVTMTVALAVTLVISWETGLTSYNWWDLLHRRSPPPIVKAPARPPQEPIGLAPAAPKGNDSSVSPIPLDLILVSVHLGRTPADSSAEIGVVRESPQTYMAGALLENGARLAEIHDHYVVLKKAPYSARLYLNSSSSGDKALLAVGGTAQLPPTRAKVTSREELTEYIRPSPVYDGDALVGYQVYAGAHSEVFSQMGLRAGDMIVALDDTPLTESEAAWNLLRRLADGQMLSASVKRGSELIRLSLDGSLITQAEERARQPPQAMLAPLAP
jgi:type II secretion system protein C